jgi:hypothetical protein
MFNGTDGELANCNERIDHIKRNAQFLADIKDDHEALKDMIDIKTTGVECV